jgi:hypothetical protein
LDLNTLLRASIKSLEIAVNSSNNAAYRCSPKEDHQGVSLDLVWRQITTKDYAEGHQD